MTTFLTRYQRGEYEQVWHDLLRYGKTVRRRTVYSDAYAVARETMTRVRTNIEQIVRRLHALDYTFDNPAAAFVPPPRDAYSRIAELERRTGTLPVSLRVFYELVGSVDLRGSFPALLPGSAIPLVVPPPEQVGAGFGVEAAYSGFGDVPSYALPVVLPALGHTSGEFHLPYTVTVPNLAVDAELEGAALPVTFVRFLRIALRNGGFPGCELLQPGARPEVEIAFLTRDVMPI